MESHVKMSSLEKNCLLVTKGEKCLRKIHLPNLKLLVKVCIFGYYSAGSLVSALVNCLMLGVHWLEARACLPWSLACRGGTV